MICSPRFRLRCLVLYLLRAACVWIGVIASCHTATRGLHDLSRCDDASVNVYYVSDDIVTRTAIRPTEVARMADVILKLRSKSLSRDVKDSICSLVQALYDRKIVGDRSISAESLDWRMAVFFRDRVKDEERVFVFDGAVEHCWHDGVMLAELDQETRRLARLVKAGLERMRAAH